MQWSSSLWLALVLTLSSPPLQYATTEEAVATRDALHRVKWPQSNPKVLNVDFCEQEEVMTGFRGNG